MTVIGWGVEREPRDPDPSLFGKKVLSVESFLSHINQSIIEGTIGCTPNSVPMVLIGLI